MMDQSEMNTIFRRAARLAVRMPPEDDYDLALLEVARVIDPVAWQVNDLARCGHPKPTHYRELRRKSLLAAERMMERDRKNPPRTIVVTLDLRPDDPCPTPVPSTPTLLSRLVARLVSTFATRRQALGA